MDISAQTTDLLTAEDFLDRRWDDPDVSRWTELVAGRLVQFEAPDPVHGNVVLNLSKLVADFVHREPNASCPAFDLGLVVGRSPDTVRYPLIAWFAHERPFEHGDESLCEQPPPLVIDVVSNPDRRRTATERVLGYLDWGVETVWLFDAGDRSVQTQSRGAAPTTFGHGEMFVGRSEPFTLQVPVTDLFADPPWWNGPRRVPN